LDAADFRVRMSHLGWGVLAAVLFLKAVQWLTIPGWNGPSKLFCPFSRLCPRKKLILLFVLALLAFNAGSLILTQDDITFAGDEPHYLLITHSLLKDGDFDLKNNYASQDYKTYMDTPGGIAPHTAPGTEGRLSFHSPGISILLFPFYGLGSLLGGKWLILFIRFGMSLFAALLGLQVYLYVLEAWRKEKAALWIWFLSSFTAPVLFYGLHVYGELVVALIGFTVFRFFKFRKSFKVWELAALGSVLACMIWFHERPDPLVPRSLSPFPRPLFRIPDPGLRDRLHLLCVLAWWAERRGERFLHEGAIIRHPLPIPVGNICRLFP
jgi:hypothetical protein